MIGPTSIILITVALFRTYIYMKSIQLNITLFIFSAIIHDSTISCLRKFEYESTATLLEYFRDWWKIISVKTPQKGVMQKDEFCNPILSDDDWKLEYLLEFVDWMKNWRAQVRQKERKGLSQPTFDAIIGTTEGIVLLSKHLLRKPNWNYVLTGSFVSDPLEKR